MNSRPFIYMSAHDKANQPFYPSGFDTFASDLVCFEVFATS
jgi:hypothetical protein